MATVAPQQMRRTPTIAAATETAASMGGLIMPPMMGAGAFLMSEFLGVPYWDVVTRGFAQADADHDGTINRDEFMSSFTTRAPATPPPALPTPPAE